jgi:hypothetical protein
MPRKSEHEERQLPLNFEVGMDAAPPVQVELKKAEVVYFASFSRSKSRTSSDDAVLDRLLREATRLSW